MVQVVLCRHLGVGGFCRDLFCDIRLCGWHHPGAWEEYSVRFGKDLWEQKRIVQALSDGLRNSTGDYFGTKWLGVFLLTYFDFHPPFSQVSATFAASLVTSPAIGAYLSEAYGDTLVVILATAIALLDICFILVAVPESLPEKMRPASWGAPISWEQADPFAVSDNTTRPCSESSVRFMKHFFSLCCLIIPKWPHWSTVFANLNEGSRQLCSFVLWGLFFCPEGWPLTRLYIRWFILPVTHIRVQTTLNSSFTTTHFFFFFFLL